MKPVLIAAAALAVAAPAFAQSHDHHAQPTAETPSEAEGVGVVRSIDVKAGKAVIAHEPMPAINWPAMTMAFKVADKEGLAAVKPGQKVRFTLSGQTVTTIRPF